MQGSDSESRPGTCPGPMPSNMSLFAHGPAAGWQIRGPAAGRTHATLGYSFAIYLLINQGVMATLQKRRLGYHSLPSGSRTRNLRILDPAYRPIRYGGIYAHIKRDSDSESGRRGVQRSPSSHPFMISPSPDQPPAVNARRASARACTLQSGMCMVRLGRIPCRQCGPFSQRRQAHGLLLTPHFDA
jgi:hypothetical protein